MAIKVQLNSLKALERLIGGDSEIEIEIRNSIVQEFTKRYLKALVTEDHIKTLRTELDIELKRAKDQIQKETQEVFGKYDYVPNPNGPFYPNNKQFIWNPEFKSRLEAEVINPVVNEFVNSTTETCNQKAAELYSKLEPDILPYIESVLDKMIKEKVEVMLANKIDTIVCNVLNVEKTS